MAVHDVIVEKRNCADRQGPYSELIAEVPEIQRDGFWDEVAIWVDEVQHYLPQPSPSPDEKLDENAFLSAPDLAHIYGLPVESLRKRLERFRKGHLDGWSENSEAKPGEPKYTYKLGAVLPIINSLRAKDS